MSQKTMILQILKEDGKITPLDAFRDCACLRLASRIHELIQDGHPIESQMVSSTNRFGTKVSFAEYSLAPREGQMDLL